MVVFEKGSHGNPPRSFEELDFAGQARAINGMARTMEKAINAHLRQASIENRDVNEIRQRFHALLQRVIARL